MSLQTYPDLIQGSEEWLTLRRGIVTASVVGQLITPKTVKPANNDAMRGLTATLVAERITGWTEEVYVSDDMMRGNLDERIARDLYSKTYAPVTQSGFMVRTFGEFKIGYSPDGLVGDDGLIEIKSRRPKKHIATIISGEMPLENMAQCQAGLFVSGRKWLDYCSFCGGLPMWRERVEPDLQWFDAITDAIAAFETTAVQMLLTYDAAVAGLPATERTTYEEMMVI